MDYKHPNNFYIPHFTTAEMCRLVGVNLETVRRWIKLGYLTLSMDNPGRGRQRLYSLSDIIQICVVNYLSDYGFMPSFYTDTMAKVSQGLAILKIIYDWAVAEGVQVFPPSKDDIEKACRELGIVGDEADMYVNHPCEWTHKDRYLIIYRNREGVIDSMVSENPICGVGAWIVVDVHGIVDETMKQIPMLDRK